MRLFAFFPPLLFLLFTPISASSGDFRIVTNIIPPLKYEENGIAQGMFVDILEAMMEKMGESEIRPSIQIMSWSRAFEEVSSQPKTIMVSMAKTKAREQNFHWVGPIYKLQLGLIGKRNLNATISTLEDASKLKVGVQANTAPAKLLFKQGFPAQKAHRLVEMKNGLLLLNEDRLDLWAHAVQPCLHTMRQYGMDPAEYTVHYTIAEVDIYIALSKDFEQSFVTEMQTAFEALLTPSDRNSSEYDRILSKYEIQ